MRAKFVNPGQIERVVVRGTSWVGDAVMTVPALRALRRTLPHAHITLATRAWAEGIFAGAEFLDEILIEDQPRKNLSAFLRQRNAWAERRFDLAILFQNSFHSALVAFAARVPLRLGYAAEGRGPLLTHAIKIPRWRHTKHEVYHYLHLIAELERSLHGNSRVEDETPQYELQVSCERQREARQFLRSRGVLFDRPLVALCPGSTNSRAKRWPARQYAALADRLIEELHADLLIIGSREEMGVTEEAASHMSSEPIILTGSTELGMSVAILSLTDLLITNDTGPAHIAASLGRPTLVIFGPTNPVATRPFSPTARIIREPPACAPCMLRDCPIDHRCMTAITPERVYAQAVALLDQQLKAEAAR